MSLLEHCIGRSLQLAIGVSLADFYLHHDDINLMNIELKIDKDFINKDGEKKFFKELLAQAFRRITQQHPIPMTIDMLQSQHPFAQRYLLNNGTINVTEIFKNRCDFFGSHDHFELQIADILGTILHRNENKNEAAEAINRLDRVLGAKGQIKIQHVLNPNPDEHVEIAFDNPT